MQGAVLSLPPLGEDLDDESNRSLARYNTIIEGAALLWGVAYLPLNEELTALLEGANRKHPRLPYRFSVGQTLSSALRRYVGRKSWDDVAAHNGYLLLTDGVHLSDRAAAVAADLIADWLSLGEAAGA